MFRYVLLIALTGACGGKSKGVSIDAACKNLVSIVSGLDKKECTTILDQRKSAMPAGAFQEMTKCMASATTEKLALACMEGEKTGEELSEAEQHLRILFAYVRSYYHTPSAKLSSLAEMAEANQLPSSIGPTPAKGICCSKYDGECPGNEEWWQGQTWKTLGFSIPQAHQYSYEYTLNDDKKSFVLRAYGDVDCDGVYSVYSLYGAIADDDVHTSGELKIENKGE